MASDTTPTSHAAILREAAVPLIHLSLMQLIHFANPYLSLPCDWCTGDNCYASFIFVRTRTVRIWQYPLSRKDGEIGSNISTWPFFGREEKTKLPL